MAEPIDGKASNRLRYTLSVLKFLSCCDYFCLHMLALVELWRHVCLKLLSCCWVELCGVCTCLTACGWRECGRLLAGWGAVSGHGWPVHQLKVCQVLAASWPDCWRWADVFQVHAGQLHVVSQSAPTVVSCLCLVCRQYSPRLSGARFTKYLTIYHKIILSLS